jgi:hypothetical protein
VPTLAFWSYLDRMKCDIPLRDLKIRARAVLWWRFADVKISGTRQLFARLLRPKKARPITYLFWRYGTRLTDLKRVLGPVILAL